MTNQLTKDLNITGKKILLRLDLNVPVFEGAISETSRIEKIIPTIKMLKNKKTKIIIISHIGRPKGKWIKELTLKNVAIKLSNFLDQKIIFHSEPISPSTKNQINLMKDGDVMLLENIRFYEGEENNDNDFAKKISELGDIYINDAFSCSHRAHASIEAITKFIPSYFGLQISEEINALKKLTSEIKVPVSCIIGGSKISTKINIISNLIKKKINNIIIVGGMANNIIKENGFNIGKSIYEKNTKEIVKNIFEDAKKLNCKVLYPVDVVTSKDMKNPGKIKNLQELNNEDIILDIGPKTIQVINNVINASNTILWNGPAGYFESSYFEDGTKQIAKSISIKTKKDKIFSIIGGGDTVAAINKFGLSKNYTFVSTAGGAFLEFLEGKKLPGIKAIEINTK